MGVFAAVRHPRRWHYGRTRRRLGARLVGSGLEIGALHSPFPVGTQAHVRYVDHLTTEGLRAHYPELADLAIVHVDVVDDGERLPSVPDASQDFVIASHVVEHCEDPIATLEAHLRVLRPGGRLLWALPDRRRGVDRHRDATTLEHLVADHEEGPQRSRGQHYRDWARLVDLPLGTIPAERVDAHATALEARGYSIHFHCWSAGEFTQQLRAAAERYRLPVADVRCRDNHHEFLVTVVRG